MQKFMWAVAMLGLLLTIIPPFLVFNGTLTLPENYRWMTVGMVLWFGSRIILSRQNTLAP